MLRDESVATLKELLIPRSYAITPNVPEAETLTGMTISSLDDRKKAAEQLVKMGAQHVIIKGGHQPEDNHITDLLLMAACLCKSPILISIRSIRMAQAAPLLRL